MRHPILLLMIAGLLVGCGADESTAVPTPIPTSARTPVPVLAEHDEVVVVGGGGGYVGSWEMGEGCRTSAASKGVYRAGARLVVLAGRCYDSLRGDHYYQVGVTGRERDGWVKEEYLVLASEYVEPTKTPTVTADSVSKFEKCMASVTGVRYVISGDSVWAVSLTLENDTQGTEQGNRSPPFCLQYTDFVRGDFLYISVQITKLKQGSGRIKCQIYDGTSVISEANAKGFASIATCSGTKR